MICRTHTANYHVERHSNCRRLSKDTATADSEVGRCKHVDVRTYVGDFLSTSRVIFVRPNAARG